MGKGGGGGDVTSTTEPWEASQPFLRNLLGGTEAMYGAGGFDIPPWPGIRVAPQSGMTQAGLQGISDIATAGNPIIGPAQGAFGRFMDPDPYRDLDVLKERALGEIMPAAMSRFSGAGMLDSTLAADAGARAATQAIAPFEYGAYEQGQNRQLQALGMAPQLAQASYLDPMMLGQAGGQMDQYSQRVLDAAQGAYGQEATRPYDELQRAASLALGFGGLGGEQVQEQGGGGGGTMETIGGVMQVLGPLAMMFMASDRRLKRDIVRVGKTEEGYPQYEFRYWWDRRGTVRTGVMADEVPDEITIEIGGFLAVDYSRVNLMEGTG